jgi:hypothetical protein
VVLLGQQGTTTFVPRPSGGGGGGGPPRQPKAPPKAQWRHWVRGGGEIGAAAVEATAAARSLFFCGGERERGLGLGTAWVKLNRR